MMKPKISPYLALFTALALLLVSLPLGGQAAPRPPQVNANGVGFTMALLDNNQAVRNMGADWVEYTLSWRNANPANGSYNWGDADNIMNYGSGLNVIIRVMDTPDWARPSGTPPSNPPSNYQTFQTFMTALTSRLTTRGTPPAAFEIWNEPNLDYNWGGQCPNPTDYMRLVQAGSAGVRAVNGNIKLLAGAVTTTADYIPPQGAVKDNLQPTALHVPLKIKGDQISECHIDDILFIRGMYQNSAGIPPSVFDVISSHPYGFAYAPETDPRDTRYKLVYRRAELQHNEMVANGDPNKPMWFTEFGWPIDPQYISGQNTCARPDWYFIQSPQQQADYYVRALEYSRNNWPWAQVQIGFNFDFVLAPWFPDRCQAFGFFSIYGYWQNNYTPRPAYYAIANWIASPPPSPTPTFTPTPVDTAPQFGGINFNQTQFNRNGGNLVIQAGLIDGDGTPVSTAFALVTPPGGTPQSIAMSLVNGSNTSGIWQASYQVPANSGSNPLTYNLQIIANDTGGQSNTSGVYQIISQPYRFWDVPNSYWAATYINTLAQQGILGGYADGGFHPASGSRRDEVSRMLSLAYGWALVNPATPTFPDVPTNNWAYRYIETAVAQGAVSGYPDGLFHPGLLVNRGQLSIMLVKASGWQLLNPSTATFTDVPVGSWSFRHVETAYAHGIVGGYGDGTFRPTNPVTRAELARFLYRIVYAPTATATPPNLNATNTATPILTFTPEVATPTVNATSPTATPTVTPTTLGKIGNGK